MTTSLAVFCVFLPEKMTIFRVVGSFSVEGRPSLCCGGGVIALGAMAVCRWYRWYGVSVRKRERRATGDGVQEKKSTMGKEKGPLLALGWKRQSHTHLEDIVRSHHYVRGVNGPLWSFAV
jgi:hypothetical protein